MNLPIKTFCLLYFLCSIAMYEAKGHCRPTTNPLAHDLIRPGHHWSSDQTLSAGSHDNTNYIEEDLCGTEDYLLVFFDEFEGSIINTRYWGSAGGSPTVGGAAWGLSDVYTQPFESAYWRGCYIRAALTLYVIRLKSEPDELKTTKKSRLINTYNEKNAL